MGVKKWLVVILLPRLAFGGVLFQAPTAPDLDYRAALKADSNLSSAAEWLLRRRPLATHHELLLRKFAEAQRAFLGGSKAQAKQAFLAVTDLRNLDDWKASDREILLNAYLRLAQLEAAGTVQDQWLLHSLNIGPDLKPDDQLFPPPLLERRLALAKTSAKVSPPQVPQGWNVVMINGILCDQECPSLYQVAGALRFTFLSNRWLPFTVEAEPGVKVTPSQRIAWLSGQCNEERFHADSDEAKDRRGFWSEACLLAELQKPVELQLDKPVVNSIAQEIALPTQPETSERFYQNKWFWVGTAGLIAAAILLNNQKDKENEQQQQPTTTYGY